MKSKIFAYKSVAAALTMAAAFGLTACGEESNSASPVDENPAAVSSSSIATTPVSEGVVSNSSSSSSSSSSIGEPATETSNGCAAGQVPSPVAFPQDKFNDIGEVYKNIQCNEKVVFIVRHADRDLNNYSGETPLLMEGYEASVAAGQKMVGDGQFKYIFSGMLRTYQTAAGIATGRGDAACVASYDENDQVVVNCPEFKADTLTQLKDGWYVKDKDILKAYQEADTTGTIKSSPNPAITAWAYDGTYADAFYDLKERSEEFLKLIITDYSAMPKYTLAASHDQVLTPLTIWATEKKIDIKLHDPNSLKWLNFLAGLAIIINDKNELRYAAIKGMNDKVMADGTVYDGGVQ